VTSAADRPKKLWRVAETLALAAAGGGALGLAGMPAGWLSGAILAVGIAAFAGRPVRVPAPLTRTIFVVIGISLGAVVTPDTLRGATAFPASIAALIVAMIGVSVASTAYLCLVHRWQLLSAYLASSPGGMSQVLVVAAELGADLRGVAIIQSMRVVIIALGLPAGMALAGLAGKIVRRSNGPLTLAVADDLAILVVVSAAVALIAYRLRFPGGLLFGAMFASAALHGFGFVHAVVPPWVANAAMIMLGGVVGSRFANMPLRLFLTYLAASVGSFAISVLVAGLFAVGVTMLLSLHGADVMIAFAPGSVDAMMLLALALHIDPVYVGAHHVARVIFVSLAIPFVARRIAHVPPEVVKTPPERPTFQD
jgi:membrane AbrB-like protein